MTEIEIQRDSALAEANRRRIARANDKRKMAVLSAKDCISYFCTILKEKPPHWENAHLIELLAIIPGVNTTRADKICTHPLDKNIKVKDLTTVTASRLAMRVGSLAPTWIDGIRKSKSKK